MVESISEKESTQKFILDLQAAGIMHTSVWTNHLFYKTHSFQAQSSCNEIKREKNDEDSPGGGVDLPWPPCYSCSTPPSLSSSLQIIIGGKYDIWMLTEHCSGMFGGLHNMTRSRPVCARRDFFQIVDLFSRSLAFQEFF